MSSNLFEKIIRIVQIALSLLEMALKSFRGLDDNEGDTTA